jgi:proline iminopeptidase
MNEIIAYHKEVLDHQTFYIAKFTKKIDADYLLFIHGGPGYNCGVIEYLIEHHNLFGSLNYNIILYDQRSCGRSNDANTESVLHTDNVSDLDKICAYLDNSHDIKLKGFIGHSYGAKLLFDFYRKFDCKIPGIFISTANSILKPRLNNLVFDLAYLKKTNPSQYKNILCEMNQLTIEKLWELTEELSPIFKENEDRIYLYWANMDIYEQVNQIQNILKLPLNEKTFMSVRKDLYTSENNFSVDIDTLKLPYLWINGIHDFIMNGTEGILSNKQKITAFYQSSHYPHLEENQRLCELINLFIKNTGH